MVASTLLLEIELDSLHGTTDAMERIGFSPLITETGHQLLFTLNPEWLSVNQGAIHIPEEGLQGDGLVSWH
jgi:hypothetical protein